MTFSWSQIAAPAAGTPKVISIASNAPATAASATVDEDDHAIATDATTAPSSAAPLAPAPSSSGPAISPEPTQSDVQPEAGPSRPAAPRLKHLILDAGPLLSLTPLRHLAEAYHTTPAVLAELRDPKAREYWDRLALQGVDVRVEQPSPESMARVMAFARKTGDYAVLSQTDLGVVALTLQYEVKENGEVNVRSQPGEKKGAAASGQTQKGPKGQSGSGKEGLADVAEAEVEGAQDDGEVSESEDKEDDEAVEAAGDGVESENEAATPIHTETDHEATTQASAGDLSQTLDSTHIAPPPAEHSAVAEISTAGAGASAAAEESDPESDGEWITPSNLTKHRSKDLGLLPSTSPNASQVQLAAAAMTGDFAVQNVLLAMGLGLVGEGGERIAKVKSWVLRCHACFKICRDPSKRFCPSCGGPTLMRTNVTTTANGKMHLHLKSNYQYNLRGTKFTIPDAKPGRAKGQIKAGTGLILREDQREWQDAVRLEEGRRRKEEKKAQKGGWEDPDWLPEILTVGMSGKGRSGGQGMPAIGHGRKNPNVARRKR